MKTSGLLYVFLLSAFAALIFLKPGILFSQDSSGCKKVLVAERSDQIERLRLRSGGLVREVPHREFDRGSRVVLKLYSDNSPLMGKIDSIADSSVNLKGQTIFLNNIRSIRCVRGEAPFIIGNILMASGFSMLWMYNRSIGDETYNYLWKSPSGGIFASIFWGFFTTLYGVIELTKSKEYRMDKGYIVTARKI